MLYPLLRGEIGLDVFLSWLLAMAIGLTVHEFCHAKRADMAGDRTPRLNGRVTLNPLAHYDLMGTTMLLVFGFGWGKPVPINPLAFRHPRSDTIAVSLAGVVSNMVIAVLAALPIRLGLSGAYTMPLAVMVYLNLILAVFNLIPVPPLDGSHVLQMLLPLRLHRRVETFYARNAQWLFLALLALVFTGIVGLPVRLLFVLFTGLPSI
ncbi:site-2 protease family protein [bacterium]|nr:site-2 protease family protein [bacterium]